jgi:hypothetical protein
MTTTKETCPKCGAELKKESHIFAIAIFVCGSRLEADFTQSDRCRIAELEKGITELKREADKALNEKPGLESGACQWISLHASALLEKKG